MSSLQGIFNTAVQGMNAQSTAMSIISTNIDNVTTTGYKNQTSNFETILNGFQEPQQSESLNGQGTPVISTYMGVADKPGQNVDQQGQIATTDRTLDLALNGRGFIVTNTGTAGNGTWEYTRDGSFTGQTVQLTTSTNGSGAPDQGSYLTTANGAYVYGWPVNADGTFTETNNLSALKPVQFATNTVLPAQATSTIQVLANISAGTTGRQSVGLPFIDESGTSQTLTLGFTATGGASWNLDVSASDSSSVNIQPPTISFAPNGSIASPSNGQFTVTVNQGSGPQTMTVNLAQMTAFNGNGNITVNTINQNGYIQGQLNSTYFTTTGVLMGSYNNGQLQPLYMLPVAMFPADNGLQAIPGNAYVQTQASGAPSLVGVNSQGAGTGGTAFVPGALESSAVDLGQQFSQMIVTQKAYSSSAQVFKTADQMTQAVRDLIE